MFLEQKLCEPVMLGTFSMFDPFDKFLFNDCRVLIDSTVYTVVITWAGQLGEDQIIHERKLT